MVLFTAVCLAAVAFGVYRLAAALRRSWRQAGDTLDRIRCEGQAPAAIEKPPHPDSGYRLTRDERVAYRQILTGLIEDTGREAM